MRASLPVRGSSIFRELHGLCRVNLFQVDRVLGDGVFVESPIESAKQFLVDYIGHSREAFLAGRFQNTPTFPDTVPDLEKLVAHDAGASPPEKYALLADVARCGNRAGLPPWPSPEGGCPSR